MFRSITIFGQQMKEVGSMYSKNPNVCKHCGLDLTIYSEKTQRSHVENCLSINANRKDLQKLKGDLNKWSKMEDSWDKIRFERDYTSKPSKTVNTPSAKDAVSELLSALGENVTREGLLDTPRRVAEMYAELTSGYQLDPKEIVEKAIFKEGSSELVIVRDIPFYSLCEHHLAPFFGTATIGYVPVNGRVVGLSKLARVLDAFAKRLQVQERLGAQIADTLYTSVLNPNGVGVYISAEHLCMAMRGVQKPGTSTVTNILRGCIKNGDHKEEWMRMVAGR